jgi:RHS repeat-associated protein
VEVKILGTGSTTSSINWQNLQIWKPQMVQEEVLVDICEKDGDRYMFGFNNMPKDNEIAGIGNSIDYKARQLDTRIGRFWSVDPLTKKFPMLTPYQFASNTPIWGVDLSL